MRHRAIEILFRHKLLLVLPFLLIVPATAALVFLPQPVTWQTSARIWVEQDPSIYTDPRLGYAPAPNQAALLGDFVHSRSFGLAVLQQTSLAPQLRTQRQIDEALALFGDSVSASAVSNNFINITVAMPDRQLSFQTAQAIIANYQSTLQAQEQAFNDQAIKLFGDSLQQAQTALTKTQNDISTYLISHPSLADSGNSLNLPVTSRDPNLAVLMQRLTDAQSTYDNLRDRYFGVQSSSVLSGTFAPFAFKVIDPPQLPTEPNRARKLDLLKYPAIGFMAALLLSATIGTVLVLSDRTVVSAPDLETLLGLPVLGELPELRTRHRLWQHPHPDLVRLGLSGPARPRNTNGNRTHS